jgi:hypothetical protein
MLQITFLNDGTGDEVVGNYHWKVMINDTVLAKGVLKDHNRLTGWEGLVHCFSSLLLNKKIKKHIRRK